MSGLDHNARIVDLWNRRATLTVPEWSELYRLSVPLLMRTRLPDDYRDEARRTALVTDFFQDKILLNAETSQAGPLVNAHALHGYLQHYEMDLRRKRPAEESLDVLRERDSFDVAAAPLPPAHTALLSEAGIDPGHVMHSADRFVATLQPAELGYLRHASCNEGKAEPISRIAERLTVGASYHLMAKRLGITRSKGETYRGYEKTKIGAWLLSTGAQLHPDWREELATLLLVLCRQVRLHVMEAE
jgi:hypothetical protein